MNAPWKLESFSINLKQKFETALNFIFIYKKCFNEIVYKCVPKNDKWNLPDENICFLYLLYCDINKLINQIVSQFCKWLPRISAQNIIEFPEHFKSALSVVNFFFFCNFGGFLHALLFNILIPKRYKFIKIMWKMIFANYKIPHNLNFVNGITQQILIFIFKHIFFFYMYDWHHCVCCERITHTFAHKQTKKCRLI